MSKELSLIRRLVEQLRQFEDEDRKLHKDGYLKWPVYLIYDGDVRCPCPLCSARQWLDGRDAPEDKQEVEK